MITSIYLKLVHALISLKYKLFGIKYSEIYNVESKNGSWNLNRFSNKDNAITLGYKSPNNKNPLYINLTYGELEDLMNLVNELKR